MKPLYIHIGMPKTGSSAIQAFLTLNYNTLKKRGVLFPNPPKLTQFQTSGGNIGEFYKLFIHNDLNKIKSIIESFNDKKKLVLSSEELFHVLREYPKRFSDVFCEYDYKIICYVRRQDNLISSSYNQLIKNHDVANKEIIDHISNTHDFTKALLESLKYIGSDKFVIRPYEKQQFYGGNIFSDFLNCIGLQLDGDFIFPEKIVNPSLNRVALEFRRILNLLHVDIGNPKVKSLINTLLAKYTIDKNMGQPFQDNNILSSQERINILNEFKDKDEQIAKKFLNRESGKLFYDDIPSTVENEQNVVLTFEKALDICKFILNTKYKDNLEEELIKSIAKGTVDRLLDNIQPSKNHIKDFHLIYSLKNKPVALSDDILTIEKKLDFWFIESIGDDPHFTIPDFNYKNNNGKIIIKIEITASSDTALQLFYITDNKNFDEDHSKSKHLKKGHNEFIIEIKENKPIKSFRLDPSNVEGIYLLHTFEVRGRDF